MAIIPTPSLATTLLQQLLTLYRIKTLQNHATSRLKYMWQVRLVVRYDNTNNGCNQIQKTVFHKGKLEGTHHTTSRTSATESKGRLRTGVSPVVKTHNEPIKKVMPDRVLKFQCVTTLSPDSSNREPLTLRPYIFNKRYN